MIRKMAAFIVLAFLAVPFASLAQSPSSPEKSIESLSAMDISEDSIVVLSKEETRRARLRSCRSMHIIVAENLSWLITTAPPLIRRTKDVLRFERQMCSRQQNNDYDSSND